jgi:putative heme-binding domain-containing protein
MRDVRLSVLAVAVAWLIGIGLLDNTVKAQSLTVKLKAEGAASLADAARQRGNAVQGAILFPQQVIGCANCHAAGGQNLLGPDLGEMGPEATDIYLAEALLVPSKVIRKGFESVTVITRLGKTHVGRVIDKAGDHVVLRLAAADRRLITLPKSEIEEIAPNAKSAMPDGLVDQLKDRQQFLDILKYMMEIKAAGPSRHTGTSTPRAGAGELDAKLRGLVLLDDFKCAACHGDIAAGSSIPPKQAPRLAWAAGRINPRYIERFIAAPSQVKPGTTMPNTMGMLEVAARQVAAREITHFLVSLGSVSDRRATFQTQPLDQVAAERGRELFHSVGCVACHSPRGEDGVERLAKSSVPLGRIDQKYNINGLVALLENPHVVRPSGRMPNMQLSHWEASDVAHYLLITSGLDVEPPFRLDRMLAEKGKTQFRQLGCDRCHTGLGSKIQSEGSDAQSSRSSQVISFANPSFSAARKDRGCLSENVGRWPHYELGESQRSAMRAALQRGPIELTEHQQIALTLATFNCVVCHQRGNMGGVPTERDEYFHTTNPNLGPQGRIPPPLTNVGAKLKPKWMRQVLVSGRTIRPYLLTRMPQYGADNVAHIVDLFQRVDQLPEVKFATFTDLKLMRNAGSELAGTGGLNCIACHTFQQKPAATMSAVDLTEMAERLEKNWFHHYMLNPQRLSTNTVMPSFWPGGRTIRKDILDGKTDLQVEAMWQYLLDGRQARTPRGLIRKPIELVAKDEAVMLRRKYQGIGKRGIGVGYPNQVNLAFDAEQMRLAMIWKGKFADPAGVWRSQGHGSVRPLGRDLIRFAVGPELDDAVHPWPVDEGRPPRHQFKGYDLDLLQRPTLKYRFDTIDVEDYPLDVRDEASGGVLIRRTLTFTSELGRPDVVFRVATGQKIVLEENGTFLIGKSLRIRIDAKHRGQIVKTPAGPQLRIPLDIGPGKSTLVIEYAW